MIIGYTRVSTQDQNAELQLYALNEAGCEQIYTETIKGKLRERPELSLCLRSLHQGDTLVVWRMDRLARSLKDLIEIIEDLHHREIGFKTLNENNDTTCASGKHIFHIFGALAEFEHRLIIERTKAGLAAARARGRKGGRKPTITEADVRKAVTMLSDPMMTKTEVAQQFKVIRTALNASFKRDGFLC